VCWSWGGRRRLKRPVRSAPALCRPLSKPRRRAAADLAPPSLLAPPRPLRPRPGSVLEVGDGVFEVLSTSGDTHLGGDDFDKRVVDWLADGFMANEGEGRCRGGLGLGGIGCWRGERGRAGVDWLVDESMANEGERGLGGGWGNGAGVGVGPVCGVVGARCGQRRPAGRLKHRRVHGLQRSAARRERASQPHPCHCPPPHPPTPPHTPRHRPAQGPPGAAATVRGGREGQDRAVQPHPDLDQPALHHGHSGGPEACGRHPEPREVRGGAGRGRRAAGAAGQRAVRGRGAAGSLHYCISVAGATSPRARQARAQRLARPALLQPPPSVLPRQMCSDLLERCRRPVEQALKDAKLDLAGG
jgi:hypothetical protein